jgi:hypothetical protein
MSDQLQPVSKHSVSFIGSVVVTINDPDVIERITGPGGDDWRKQAYQLHTRDEIVQHLAYNCIANGRERANELDGWADLPDDAATMGVEGIEADGEVITEGVPHV